MRKFIGLTAAGAVLLVCSTGTASTGVAVAAQPQLVGGVAVPMRASGIYKNCTALNQKYQHGLGKTHAKDKVRGNSLPVKNFKKSTSLYNKAMSHNRGLDRDHDGVACEKH